MRLQQLQTNTCRLCKQLVLRKNKKEGEISIFFGETETYLHCPLCFQEVPKENQTPNYKRQWTLRVKRLKKQWLEERQDW
jgi:hypothetical protein